MGSSFNCNIDCPQLWALLGNTPGIPACFMACVELAPVAIWTVPFRSTEGPPEAHIPPWFSLVTAVVEKAVATFRSFVSRATSHPLELSKPKVTYKREWSGLRLSAPRCVCQPFSENCVPPFRLLPG